MSARLLDLVPLHERILLSLRTDGKATSLDLIGRLATGAPWWRRLLDRAILYPTLHDLEMAGQVIVFESPTVAERGGRPRRWYSVEGPGSLS
jgi:DNA-binding PadR family transcriptional regulator